MLGPGKEHDVATKIGDAPIIADATPAGWREDDRRFKIFVSYSRGDSSDFAIELTALEQRGLAAQLDTRDLEFGEKWQAQLRDFIRQADAIVFVVTPCVSIVPCVAIVMRSLAFATPAWRVHRQRSGTSRRWRKTTIADIREGKRKAQTKLRNKRTSRNVHSSPERAPHSRGALAVGSWQIFAD